MTRWRTASFLALVLSACNGAPPPPARTTVTTGTPTVVVDALRVTVDGPPQRTFVVWTGRWQVCDRGSIANPGVATAHDVRVVVTYLDHGSVVGRLTRTDAPADGGALGDIPAGATRRFAVCGTAAVEPETDRVQAAPA